MRVHLDPVGGIAGDMFAAAMLDAWPDLAPDLVAEFAAAGLDRYATIERVPHHDHTLTGTRFDVQSAERGDHHVHRHLADVRRILHEAPLGPAVRDRALAIFEILGAAEGQVHGVPLDQVTFHEVGAWDSIADVVSAAWLIERVGVRRWSSAPLPQGRGRAWSAHGELPVPTPATTILLEGCPLFDDGRSGERVTPTGAAIVRHLDPDFSVQTGASVLARHGTGFGTKVFEGMSNVLRVLAFEEATAAPAGEQILVCTFEIDDQTPEDAAVALDNLRATAAVLDVVQHPVFGKKGRVGAQVQVLARADGREHVLAACFAQTTTLGVRWQLTERATLPREAGMISVGDQAVRVKRARRPDGATTVKAEMDDIASLPGRAGREALRRRVEDLAAELPANELESGDGNDD